MSRFRKAERRKARLRLTLDGPSGSGKTLSALLIARGIAGDWDKIGLIDTERGSGELYVGAKVPGSADLVGQYSVLPLDAPFSPDRYMEAIRDAADAGMEVLIIDSLSHAWEGEGGVLEMADKAAKSSRSGNSFAAWREVTPKHNALVDCILTSPIHIICTMRTKTEYVIEENERGKKVPRKIGMAPRQRDGMEYEFTVVLDLSVEGHVASSSKDRTGLFDGNPQVPSIATGKQLLAWLEDGVEDTRETVPPASPSSSPASMPDDRNNMGDPGTPGIARGTANSGSPVTHEDVQRVLDGGPAVEPDLSPEDLMAKVRACDNVKHLGNIFRRYKKTADNCGFLPEFTAACGERKAEILGNPPMSAEVA